MIRWLNRLLRRYGYVVVKQDKLQSAFARLKRRSFDCGFAAGIESYTATEEE